MQISEMFSVLVPPQKNIDCQELLGTNIPSGHDLYRLVNNILDKAPKECNIPIIFKTDNQENPTRDLVIDYLQNRKIEKAKQIFTELSKVTSSISGNSLCFIASGTNNNKKFLFISRFPATEGIRTQIHEEEFEVELVRDIFLRSNKAYKAAYYEDNSIQNGFWKGTAVDKQVDHRNREISNYWIFDFLKSDFLITSKSGTAMFAKSLL